MYLAAGRELMGGGVGWGEVESPAILSALARLTISPRGQRLT